MRRSASPDGTKKNGGGRRRDTSERESRQPSPVTTRTSELSHSGQQDYSALFRYSRLALIACAVLYAFLAAFHTVWCMDTGWQIATGRWIIEHHQIPSTDVLSYTGFGKPWIYPILSEILFYGLYSLQGFAALTWLAAIASVVTVALLIRRGSLITALLAIVAVHQLILRINIRAELFSTVLFAAVLSLLWSYHRSGKEKLWLLPVLFLFWVNLHWGFVAGLGICAAYLFLEAGEIPFRDRRDAAQERLRKAWLWLVTAALATLVNPWGPRLYRDALGLSKDMAGSEIEAIAEFAPLQITRTAIQGAFDWRNPENSAIWWLLAAAGLAVAVALIRRRPASAAFLIASTLVAVQRTRLLGMFACTVVVIGGSILDDVWRASQQRGWAKGRLLVAITLCLCAVFVCMTSVRAFDLITNRNYLRGEEPILFGTGPSWWYPERAMEFIERERVPHNIFNVWVLGGYLTWRVPEYPVFIDGRGKPFDKDVFDAAIDLPAEAPDSSRWSEAADRWGINTLIFPASRVDGLDHLQNLPAYCQSQNWRIVYLDEVSMVVLRRSPATESLIDRLQIDCKNVQFSPPAVDASSRRGQAELFNFWSNTAFLLEKFGRLPEALVAYNSAHDIFPDSTKVYLHRALVNMQLGNLPAAEQDLRHDLELEPNGNEVVWLNLASILDRQGRFQEAVEAMEKASEVATSPERAGEICLQLGAYQVNHGHPADALPNFDRATKERPGGSSKEFSIAVAEGRAHAWWALGDSERAIQFQKEAVELAPGDAHQLRSLAELYQALGRTTEAQQTMQQIKQ